MNELARISASIQYYQSIEAWGMVEHLCEIVEHIKAVEVMKDE